MRGYTNEKDTLGAPLVSGDAESPEPVQSVGVGVASKLKVVGFMAIGASIAIVTGGLYFRHSTSSGQKWPGGIVDLEQGIATDTQLQDALDVKNIGDTTATIIAMSAQGNPCEKCLNEYTGRNSGVCILDPRDGQCSTPNFRRWCKNIKGERKVSSCQADNPCEECSGVKSGRHSGVCILDPRDGHCSTPDLRRYCKDGAGNNRVSSCKATTTTTTTTTLDDGSNPCAYCATVGKLEKGEVCVLSLQDMANAQSGKCATPTKPGHYCHNAAGEFPVKSCQEDNPCKTCSSPVKLGKGEVCILRQRTGLCTTPAETTSTTTGYYCSNAAGKDEVQSCGEASR